MKPKADQAIAQVSIRHASEMTPAGRREIAAWLRAQADSLISDGTKYASTFRGRYFGGGR